MHKEHGHIPYAMNPSSGVPVYRQLMDAVRADIASGRQPMDSILPSVRQVAKELEINPMTVSKAYSRLEAEGLVERMPGRGMRVCARRSPGPVAERRRELEPFARQLVDHAYRLGLDSRQVKRVLDPLLEELNHE
jgi:DNA-binding transcriptional regulator YhcF (GntR family)